MVKTTKKKIAKKTKKVSKPFIIGDQVIGLGERRKFQLEVASLYDYTQLTVPVEVIRGKLPGPTLFISAAIHGDEINGVEIIKRILRRPSLKKLKGTLIVIPVVNVFGFNHKSRYLPDRRDLNRCFPGNSKGSLGFRLANIFMKEIVNKCTHGIDLHTGAIHRTNLPQIRACLDDKETAELARFFGVPVIINSETRDGSLREAARKKKVKTLLYEGGQALRFEEDVIKTGVKGCISVMRQIGMLSAPVTTKVKKKTKVYEARSSYWVRATHSGSFNSLKKIGDTVIPGEVLAIISDPFGDEPYEVIAKDGGIIVGMSLIPLVSQGDAMVHIATFHNIKKVEEALTDYGVVIDA